jgi:hypothetical protein
MSLKNGWAQRGQTPLQSWAKIVIWLLVVIASYSLPLLVLLLVTVSLYHYVFFESTSNDVMNNDIVLYINFESSVLQSF